LKCLPTFDSFLALVLLFDCVYTTLSLHTVSSPAYTGEEVALLLFDIDIFIASPWILVALQNTESVRGFSRHVSDDIPSYFRSVIFRPLTVLGFQIHACRASSPNIGSRLIRIAVLVNRVCDSATILRNI
jgi:hypothetical protein